MNILHRSHARLPHRRLPYSDTDNKNREHVSYLVSIPSPMSIATFHKHFGVTRERIRQIEGKALKKLKKQALPMTGY